MKPKSRESYSAEFKAEAVELVLSRTKTVTQIARELGVARQMLHLWVREVERSKGKPAAVVFPGHGNRPADQNELDQLRREVAQLREDNDILKKAAVDSTHQRNTPITVDGGLARGSDGTARVVAAPQGGTLETLASGRVGQRYCTSLGEERRLDIRRPSPPRRHCTAEEEAIPARPNAWRPRGDISRSRGGPVAAPNCSAYRADSLDGKSRNKQKWRNGPVPLW